MECPPGTTCVNGLCMGGSSDGACFLAGTRVSMSDGSFGNIEDVEVGDLVKSYNPSTGEVVSGEVVIVFRHTPEEMREDYYLIINQKMSITPEHRIFTSDGLTEAGELIVGSEMVNEEGGLTVIETIQKVSERVYTYNLEIGKYQTYFAENIAVHNLKDESGGCSWDGSLWTLGDYMWCVVISAA